MLRRLLIVAVLLLAGGFAAWRVASYRAEPPKIPFVKVTRETIVSSLATNGKIEPIEWAPARAERSGAVTRILIDKGHSVHKGDALVELDTSDIQADKAAAEARIAQIRADLDLLNRGGRPSDLADITAGIAKARAQLDADQRELDALTRLQAKSAATAYEVAMARERVAQDKLQIDTLEQKRPSLVAPTEKAGAEARIRESEAAVTLANARMAASIVRAPIDGTVYQFDLKPGAYLNAGDTVAMIGVLDRVRVTVYVDEPDLGRVSLGRPVAITWDALAGKKWSGKVDRRPSQVVPLGARQVGEVLCVIDNPMRDLLPGTNVNAEILSDTAENVLSLPKEAIQHQGPQAGVYLLENGKAVWRKVELGVGSTTRTEVRGLNEGDLVALPGDKPLKDGDVALPAQ